MKTLLLLRHAKSSWDDPSLSDYQRPLNNRGRSDVPRMGKVIKENNLVPDLILCSTATRARQTCELAVKAAQLACPVELLDELYHAPPKIIIDTINIHAADQPCLMIVAHNPGLEELICALTGEWEKLPTAALVHLHIRTDSWKKFTLRTDAQKVHIYRPKELSN